jgi:hypothetical protein
MSSKWLKLLGPIIVDLEQTKRVEKPVTLTTIGRNKLTTKNQS